MEQTLAVDSDVPPDTPNRGVCDWRPKRGGLPQTVGANPSSLQMLPELQRFLGSLSTCLSSRNTRMCWQRKRTNQSYGTLVLHLETILCAVRQKNTLLFKIRCYARNRGSALYHPLQPITCYLTTTIKCRWARASSAMPARLADHRN